MATASKKTATTATATAKTGARAKTLSRPPRVAPLTPEQRTRLDVLRNAKKLGAAATRELAELERLVEGRRVYKRFMRNAVKARKAAGEAVEVDAPKPASSRKVVGAERVAEERARGAAKVAELQARAPLAVTVQAMAGAASAMTLSKAELIGGIKAALLIVVDESQREGLKYALQLAVKLEG